MGEVVAEFEQRIAAYAGTKHAIAVSSGTAGLFLCLKAVGVGQGDEVITSPFSFIASSNAIVHAGAIPVFVDINRNTYNFDIMTLHRNTLYGVKAFLPVDVFGNPYDTKLMGLQGIPIILDSCESFGSKMNRPFTAAVYAFYGNKQITTAEGGCIVTDDKSIAEYCRAVRNQGRVPGDQWLDSTLLGWNFRMSDVHAAIGLVQLKHLDDILERRKRVIERYKENGITLSQRIDYKKFNPFVFVVEVENRDIVMQSLLDKGIECKPYFPTIHKQKCMANYNHLSFPVSEEVSSRTLAIPYFADMTFDEVDYVSAILKEVGLNGI
jgi:perosamine synthetase